MITQKIRTMMSEVDRHIQKKERLKAMSKIEDKLAVLRLHYGEKKADKNIL